MKTYISGAITGTTDYMERFEKAEQLLKAQGREVVNPTKLPLLGRCCYPLFVLIFCAVGINH
jgi:hypothetical protein